MKYCPSMLGSAKQAQSPGGSEADQPLEFREQYESWHEGVDRPLFDRTPHPESEILENLRRAPGVETRLWLVLGEPGAGKTRLLEEWFRRVATELVAPTLGLRVPVLTRLRSLSDVDLKLDEELFADKLWRCGLAQWAALDCPTATIYRQKCGRLFEPLWLLDGLDEVSPDVLGPDLLGKLASLRGVKLVTCRTAAFQSLSEPIARFYRIGSEYEILPLTLEQQRIFVADRIPNAPCAAVLGNELVSNTQLGVLAGNPLMLGLITELFEQGAGAVPLPISRAAFYQQAIAMMWSRKLLDQPALLRLRAIRDKVLIELARRMRLESIETSVSVLDDAMTVVHADAAIEDALRRSGLLCIDDRRERVWFPHLTFQEFYLANALEPTECQAALEQHWLDPKYEEVLALLLSMHATKGRGSVASAALASLMDWGREIHRTEPGRLWRMRRSPLRVSLHLIRRSGLALQELGEAGRRLLVEICHCQLAKIAVAHDPRIPPFLLSGLGRDADPKVRAMVARNPATPSEVLTALGRDPDLSVRQNVADNARTPPKSLAELAADTDYVVRDYAAKNVVTPPKALAALACDPQAHVRRHAVDNPAMPPTVLAILSRNESDEVRVEIAANYRTPLESLAILALDNNSWVRQSVADNSATPAEALTALAGDLDARVRLRVARNEATPAATLMALAGDRDAEVRSWVARNDATPTETLVALARDSEAYVRLMVAGNHALPTDLFTNLARDEYAKVRRQLALGTNTPTNILVALSYDSDAEVRAAVPYNARTPMELLVALSRDPDRYVRDRVANNAATPSDVLADLAGDESVRVRHTVAGHVLSPIAVLEALARDNDSWVRRSVAQNASTPPNVLTTLAQDSDVTVRESVALNAMAPPTVLAALAKDDNEQVRRRVVENTSTLPEVFTLLSRDMERLVRSEVALSPRTPSEVLAALAHDEDDHVRYMALRNPSVVLEDLMR